MKYLILALLFNTQVFASVKNNEAAPNFKLFNHNGKLVELSKYKGKTVVLEWTNEGCPFVKKHYGSGNMQNLQERAKEQGVVWLSIISSAKGKQGHVSKDEAKNHFKKHGYNSQELLLDFDGSVGQKYGAVTTPHMFVINAKGTLVYQGAIDSIASADPADIPESKNYIADILTDLKKGNTIKTNKTRPYGCSVKY